MSLASCDGVEAQMPSSDLAPSELAQRVIASAAEAHAHVAVAESLTGGLVAASLVAVPGASHAFTGGIVAYDSSLKAYLLRVDRNLLREVGPVDGEVARQMALGVRQMCNEAEFGVATTGVAGPAADPQTGQPAGTVWVGVSSVRGERAVLIEAVGIDRAGIREDAVRGALLALLEEIEIVRGGRI